MNPHACGGSTVGDLVALLVVHLPKRAVRRPPAGPICPVTKRGCDCTAVACPLVDPLSDDTHDDFVSALLHLAQGLPAHRGLHRLRAGWRYLRDREVLTARRRSVISHALSRACARIRDPRGN